MFDHHEQSEDEMRALLHNLLKAKELRVDLSGKLARSEKTANNPVLYCDLMLALTDPGRLTIIAESHRSIAEHPGTVPQDQMDLLRQKERPKYTWLW